jgi:large subunit ribosomal protein L11
VAKKILQKVKLQIPAGQATPAPPVGTALGPTQINIMEFCKAFNERTQKDMGTIIPVVITIFADRSFNFITKTPPAPVLIKKALKLDKASGEPNRVKVGRISEKDIEEIARIKMEDLNANDMEAAKKMIRGTARSMGVLVAGEAGEIASAEEIEASRESGIVEEAPAVPAEGEAVEGQAAEGEAVGETAGRPEGGA